MRRIVAGILAFWTLTTASMAAEPTPSEMSDQMRSRILNLNPNEIGVTPEKFPHPVFAVIMETGYPNGSFTLSTIADGSTSLYFSSGGGVIGAGEHQAVRDASGQMLSGAQQFYGLAEKVSAYPYPEPGQVIFYFMTFDGVHSYAALEEDLGRQRDELSSLFFAGHAVIAEIRKLQENAN